MNTLLIGAIGAVGVPALIFIINLFLSNKKVEAWGRLHGKILSAFGQRKVGKANYEKLENKYQGTLNAYILGLQYGLDSDD